MDLLTAQLDEYNKHGVPKLANFQCDLTINEEGSNSVFLFSRISLEISKWRKAENSWGLS